MKPEFPGGKLSSIREGHKEFSQDFLKEKKKDQEKVKRSENCYKGYNNIKNREELKDMINSCHYFN